MIMLYRLFYFLILYTLFGCSQDIGPVEVKWDRDTCERCRMMISHKNFATQIRTGSKTHLFDDVGCAFTWLKEHPEAKEVNMWVADYRTGKWLDASSAHYVSGQTTPMDFGLGATTESVPGSMNFEAARTISLNKTQKHQH